MEYNYENWKLLFRVMNGYVRSQALVTACELDLFTFLHKNPGSSLEYIRDKLNISLYCARVLMLGCCDTELIYRDVSTKGYHNSPAAEEMLVSESSQSMIPFIMFNDKIQRRCLIHFTESLRNNSNKGLEEFPGQGNTLYERLTEYPELETLFQQHLFKHLMTL